MLSAVDSRASCNEWAAKGSVLLGALLFDWQTWMHNRVALCCMLGVCSAILWHFATAISHSLLCYCCLVRAVQEPSASKLSAAAFISRAHAAALAASAQRRGQRGAATHSVGVYGSPAGLGSLGASAGFNSYGAEQLMASAANASALTAAVTPGETAAADGDTGAGSWHTKRPRASSSGVPEAATGLPLEHCGSLNAAQQQQVQQQSEAALASCSKISATEQLRLTHNALRASATGGGGGGGAGGVGQQPAGSSLCSSTSGLLGSMGRQSSASGGPVGAAAAVEVSTGQGQGASSLLGQQAGGAAVQLKQQQQVQPVKRRMSNHRRFASMGAVQ